MHVWGPFSHTARRKVPQTVVLLGHSTMHDLRDVPDTYVSGDHQSEQRFGTEQDKPLT